uniref:Immunoglobulin domain-containing protein n=1 Tax=Electrophorus electricus TaxID=8005 RepID=A0AAY5ENW1_ELEEL
HLVCLICLHCNSLWLSGFILKCTAQTFALMVNIGQNATFTCASILREPSYLAWFKLTNGSLPLCIVTKYYHDETTAIYLNGFKEEHFKMTLKNKSSSLKIMKVDYSDSGHYYYGTVSINKHKITFSLEKLATASHYDVLQHPVLNPVITGSNVTLNCTVLTKRCGGEHSVYSFRHGSGESHPGIIYTHGNRSGQGKMSSERCVYMLPKKNLSLSDAGTYYCAVAECGEIIFGNGTKLNFFSYLVISDKGTMDPTIFILAASNIICLLVVLLLCRRLHTSHHKGAFYF